MVFASLIFIGLFLPLFLGSYYLTPQRWRSYTLLVFSYLFYAWWRVDFALLLFAVTVFDYVVSQYVRNNRRMLCFAIAVNLGVLGYFKYANFGVGAFNDLLVSIGASPFSMWDVILPIGISFYILQGVSYLVDVYRKDCEPAPQFIDFSAYMAMFPQLIAGPVLRYKDIAPQFVQREHSWANFNSGARRFCIGFCKKVLIADTLAPLVDMTYAQSNPTMLEAWLGTLAYAAQLYFDFSGYSDMAIGLGLMIGLRFIENFNRPYLSRSITEFWRRWHISLSQWLKDYLYVPLGGNRISKSRTYINLSIVMLLGGLWHGAQWTFVAWGAWHGLCLATERAFSIGKRSARPALLGVGITFILVLLGWVLFRAEDMSQAVAIYAGMVGMHGLMLSSDIAWQVTWLQIAALVTAYGLIFSPKLKWRPSLLYSFGLLLAFYVAICKLTSESYSPFLYFQF